MSVSKFLFKKISEILSAKGVFITRSLSYRARKQVLPANVDYVRYSALGLCFEEIIAKGIQGNVAEVGVYKGNFSQRLNQLFRDRALYLFDTFEGFASPDVEVEQTRGFSTGMQNFSDTSEEAVRNRMPYPECCIFKKGFFPDTAAGIEDTFCFVSLDADLYAPIYSGLKYFYPLLSKGGYIFVHDFNNELYKGARAAVIQFCEECKVGYVPIPDSGGTAILTR